MEILKEFGVIKKNHYYLYDNFDDSMTIDFRKLRGRYYKKTNHWVFPIQNETKIVDESIQKDDTVEVDESIQTDDTVEVDESIQTDDTVEVDESIQTDDTVEVDESIQTDDTVEVDESIQTDKLLEYKYNPPREFYQYISHYIS